MFSLIAMKLNLVVTLDQHGNGVETFLRLSFVGHETGLISFKIDFRKHQ